MPKPVESASPSTSPEIDIVIETQQSPKSPQPSSSWKDLGAMERPRAGAMIATSNTTIVETTTNTTSDNRDIAGLREQIFENVSLGWPDKPGVKVILHSGKDPKTHAASLVFQKEKHRISGLPVRPLPVTSGDATTVVGALSNLLRMTYEKVDKYRLEDSFARAPEPGPYDDGPSIYVAPRTQGPAPKPR